MSETSNLKKVRRAIQKWRGRLFRNNTGAFQDLTGRWVRFGFGNDSKKQNEHMKFGDLIGGTTITITPEMVGKEIAVFTNLEVKTESELAVVLQKAERNPKSREAAQLRGIQLVRKLGGIAWFASNETDVDSILNHFLQELKK